MYIREGGFLPAPEEVLLCSKDISVEQVILNWLQGLFSPIGDLYSKLKLVKVKNN